MAVASAMVAGQDFLLRHRLDRSHRTFADAVEVVRRTRRAEGTWPHFRPSPGRDFFALEGPGRSRWSRPRALRLLDWWAG